jgi:predicted RNA-binding Zn ribbon-like protein
VYQQTTLYWYSVGVDPITDLEMVGGHPALDLVNTVEDRFGPHHSDVLRGPSDLIAWGEQAGLLTGDAGRGRGARSEFTAALELREHLTALLDARVAGRPASTADLRALAREVAAAHVAGTLVQKGDGTLCWRWNPSALATVRHTVATAASDLLASPAVARIGQCAGAGCGWFFLDTTKRGNRRWCSMRDCGQDAKSARRRAAARAPLRDKDHAAFRPPRTSTSPETYSR